MIVQFDIRGHFARPWERETVQFEHVDGEVWKPINSDFCVVIRRIGMGTRGGEVMGGIRTLNRYVVREIYKIV